MITREIATNLKHRDEVFRVLALGEATGLPVLLIGTHGVAKTQAALDYIGNGQSYVIQTSMGTRPGDIRGTVDMESFIAEKKYRTISPITTADAIIVDEIDKTNDSVRDMLLSVLREKKLFLGSEGSKQCKWRLFVGCCNKPPTKTPFWDRFVIRHDVERISNEKIIDLFDLTRDIFKVNIPTHEMATIPEDIFPVVKVMAKLGYASLSDRTISYLPKLLHATRIIWDMDIIEAAYKLASFIAPTIMTELIKELGNEADTNALAHIKNLKKLQHTEAIERIIVRMDTKNGWTIASMAEIMQKYRDIKGTFPPKDDGTTRMYNEIRDKYIKKAIEFHTKNSLALPYITEAMDALKALVDIVNDPNAEKTELNVTKGTQKKALQCVKDFMSSTPALVLEMFFSCGATHKHVATFNELRAKGF